MHTYQARNPDFRAAFKTTPRGLFRGGGIEANVEREIAAARRGAHYHLPYGRLPGHGEAAGVLLSGIRERCPCLRSFVGGCERCLFLCSCGLGGNRQDGRWEPSGRPLACCLRALGPSPRHAPCHHLVTSHQGSACRRACMHACLPECTPSRFSRVKSTLRCASMS
jgi:hypothetical protein